jgi:hypothetical protein
MQELKRLKPQRHAGNACFVMSTTQAHLLMNVTLQYNQIKRLMEGLIYSHTRSLLQGLFKGPDQESSSDSRFDVPLHTKEW